MNAVKKKSLFETIEVVEVNEKNLLKIWPHLLLAVTKADFVAIDLELSGLGSRTNAKNVEERYAGIRAAAQSRSILSLGISTFRLKEKKEKKKACVYEVHVFNIITMSSEAFTVEPAALQFLANHNFDFNKFIKSGVRYMPSSKNDDKKVCPMRSLFEDILQNSATLCLHNGLFDLCFIYEHFYAPLPERFTVFRNCIADLFPAGFLPICDSKYLAEYVTRMPSSFLEYVFRRCQGDNSIEKEKSRIHVRIEFASIEKLKEDTETVNCKLPEDFPNHIVPSDIKEHLCHPYTNHGFCHRRRNGTCEKLHDVDYAIDLQREVEAKKRMKRKRRYSNVLPEAVNKEIEEEIEEWKQNKTDLKLEDLPPKNCKTGLTEGGSHRAGVDAFMTGFSVIFQQRHSLYHNDCVQKEALNRVPLSGKADPLIVQASIFSTGTCPIHQQKIAKIQEVRDKVIRDLTTFC